MTTDLEAFVTQLQNRGPALKACASHLIKQVSEMLLAEIGEERFKPFFKIAPSFRVKDTVSAVKKLAKKQYHNPLEEMTDLVGVRFVVLLRTDLEVLEQIILRHTGWNASRERHYEYEAASDPEVFDYQSIHFLLRSVGDTETGGVVIPDNTVCEVQIRTLLQHAYAELCHDRIYKTTGAVPVSAKRVVARCMALMETTDLMFCEAAKELDQVSVDRTKWIDFLTTEYRGIINTQASGDDLVCAQIVDFYLHLLDGVPMTAVAAEVEPIPVRAKIVNRAAGGLFASPACVLCYWLVSNHYIELQRTWPNEALRQDLVLVCADLGFA
jgi:putative GTP pyrophosphokinase